jgi:hypothetical protein
MSDVTVMGQSGRSDVADAKRALRARLKVHRLALAEELDPSDLTTEGGDNA